MSKEKIEQSLSSFDPHDGLGIYVINNVGNSRQLHVVYRYSSKQIPLDDHEPSILILNRNMPDPFDIGESTRLELLTEAICRFLNTGGTLEEITDVIVKLRPGVSKMLAAKDKAETDFIDFTATPLRLIHSKMVCDANSDFIGGEHTFVTPDFGHTVTWVEGSHLDVATLGDFHETLMQELTNVGYEFTSEEQEGRSLPQLPDPQDPGDEKADPELPEQPS